ncbi:MAG: metallophosphoesterase, partial [Candidatus Riflebacteria bacterium]|nr:metallophosphoesterase [Candidatus Riflebacteria bacterium]
MKLRELLFSFIFIFVLTVCYGSEKTSITILHTNDIHARLVPTFNKDHNEVCGGTSERSGLVNIIRKEVGNNGILLLDSGDLSQGTPFFNLFKGKANYSAAKLIGYNAITTGNHEFDNGVAALQSLLAETNMRLLCCNVVHKA